MHTDIETYNTYNPTYVPYMPTYIPLKPTYISYIIPYIHYKHTNLGVIMDFDFKFNKQISANFF